MVATCICPTYGRVPFDLICMQECIYWFTRQEFPEAELLIVNDAPGQEFVCTVQNVRVINHPTRFTSLGEKYNYCVQESRGKFILPWEDDDISLPNRIRQSVDKLGSIYEYWNPRGSWYEASSKLHHNHPQGVNHNASIYRKHYAQRNPYAASNTQDADFDSQAIRQARCNRDCLTPKQWHYVYRWGHTSAGHLSGHARVNEAYAAWRKPVHGTFFLHPRMHRDYYKDTQQLCDTLP